MGVPQTTLYDYCIKHPEARYLLEEYSKNNVKSSKEIGASTPVKVKWYCKIHKHEYSAYVSNRVAHLDKAECCRNSAITVFPDLIKDFKPELNPGTDITYIRPSSHTRINWKCHKCGHIWDTECGDRVRRLSGCPNCSSRQTSKAEKLLIGYFKNLFPDTKKMKIDNTEFDVVIPELKIAIEYDGYPWHTKKKEQHIKKLQIANCSGITLINIAEYKNTPEIYTTVQNQYTPEHRVLYHEVSSDYNLTGLLPLVIEYFKQNGINLPQADNNMVQKILSEAQMKELDNSLWNSTEIPWIRNWIAEDDVARAKCISEGAEEDIRITCPNCGRQWATKAHWIKKQFRGCTKRAGGCGFQGLMGNQLNTSSAEFKENNDSRKEYLSNYYKNKRNK